MAKKKENIWLILHDAVGSWRKGEKVAECDLGGDVERLQNLGAIAAVENISDGDVSAVDPPVDTCSPVDTGTPVDTDASGVAVNLVPSDAVTNDPQNSGS